LEIDKEIFINIMSDQIPQHMKVVLEDAPSVECEECQGTQFVPAFIIKQVSALVSPTGKDTLVPVQVFKCGKCNHINELFLNGLTI
jgi:predicted nucleic acid-binding Zn ribbon protein